MNEAITLSRRTEPQETRGYSGNEPQPTKETAMRVPSVKASRAHHILCPFCESGELGFVGEGVARCNSCALPLLGSALETLRDVVGLPDAVGRHACECGHPEMRRLPDGVFHCPACGSEVLSVESERR
jgi:ribosomal protein L37AE/L43A